MLEGDAIAFAEEEGGRVVVQGEPYKEGEPAWKMVVVDDDEEVLAITRLVLRSFLFEKRSVALFCGTSGADAIRLMQAHPDAAVLLLDVVMEVESAGLDVVRYVREQLKNSFVRIILRTGQPGYAPEERVFVDYDINDYKDKAFLSTQSLLTSIMAALRSYRDLRALESTRVGLAKIIHATEDLFKPHSLKTLASGILTQLSAIIGLEETGVCSYVSSLAFSNRRGAMQVYAGSGRFEKSIGSPMEEVVSSDVLKQIEACIINQESVFFDHSYLGYFQSTAGIENFIFMEGTRPIGSLEKDLVELFSANISFAFDNLFLNREVLDTQRDVTFTLGEVIEVRSQEAGNHVRRVALYSKLLALSVGLDETQVELLFMASPLHDLGKIGVPDHILNKPGALDPKEREIIQGHTIVGYNILKDSKRSILKAGAIIAHQHHERWDGKGYPDGLKEEQIHLFARITAVADVFDALVSDRCYRKAWDLDRVLALFREERGKQFDPQLVDVFFEHLDEILEIKASLAG